MPTFGQALAEPGALLRRLDERAAEAQFGQKTTPVRHYASHLESPLGFLATAAGARPDHHGSGYAQTISLFGRF
jgi:hypothetical protein